MLRAVKILLVLSVAAWGYVGALHNFMDWQGTVGAVKAATSMVTFDGGAEKWQASSATWLVWLGALFIVMSKILTAVLCSMGGMHMWQQRKADSQAFQQAKAMALAGCGLAIFMLFFGFVVVAESWFELWRSEAMRGPVLDSALRYACLIALVAVFVGQKDAT